MCTVSTLPSSNCAVEHDLGPRLPSQAIEFGLDQFVAKPERQHDLVDPAVLQHAQMPFEQAHAAEPQQALGQLSALGQLQAQCRDRPPE